MIVVAELTTGTGASYNIKINVIKKRTYTTILLGIKQ